MSSVHGATTSPPLCSSAALKTTSLFSRPAPESLTLRSKHGKQAAVAASAPAADAGWTIATADAAVHRVASVCTAPEHQQECMDYHLCPPPAANLTAALDCAEPVDAATAAIAAAAELWLTVDLELTADEVRGKHWV